MIDDELMRLFKGIKESFEREFYGLKGITELYIKNKETDTNKIEHLLDELLDSCMNVEEAENYFFTLCDYLETIDKKSADDYRDFYKEQYEDDFEEEEEDAYQRNISVK